MMLEKTVPTTIPAKTNVAVCVGMPRTFTSQVIKKNCITTHGMVPAKPCKIATHIVRILRTLGISESCIENCCTFSSLTISKSSGSVAPLTGSSTRNQTANPLMTLKPPSRKKPHRQRFGVAKNPKPTVAIMTPKTPMASIKPRALPLCFWGKVSAIIENVAGRRQPKPIPEMALITRSCPKFCVKPTPSVHRPQRPVPIKITNFWRFSPRSNPKLVLIRPAECCELW